jgi:hypothetical protein
MPYVKGGTHPGFRRFFSDDYDEMMAIAEMMAAHAQQNQDT